MKTVIHINRQIIDRNRKTGSREPVITCKNYKGNSYGDTVIIKDKQGEEVARIVYAPDKPLSCGARVYIETKADLEILNNK